MKFSKTLVALGIVALSAAAMAQPHGPGGPHGAPDPRGPFAPGGDRALNPQPLPPGPDDRWDRRDNRDRDFRHDRDHRRWNDRDHRRNYESHRAHVHELRIGMRKREVLELPWWKHPLYTRDNGPFDQLVYADGRHGRCVLEFRFNRLAEIHCN